MRQNAGAGKGEAASVAERKFANVTDFRFGDDEDDEPYDHIPEELFTPNSRFSARGTNDNAARNDYNTRMQTIIESLRAKRSNAKDDSRAAQSSMNSLNDAVSQQSNLGTSLLQLLGGLLTSIFR
jgi:hypothetical protein